MEGKGGRSILGGGLLFSNRQGVGKMWLCIRKFGWRSGHAKELDFPA